MNERKINNLTLVDYIRTSIEILLNMKGDDFLQNKDINKNKCSKCQKSVQNNARLGSGRIEPETNTNKKMRDGVDS